MIRINPAYTNMVDFQALGMVNKEGIWYAPQNVPISYPEHGNDTFFQIEEHSYWFRHRNDCITTLVKKYAKEGPFFDVGGGNGFVAKALQAAGVEVVLIEPGEHGCMNARKRDIKNIVCATIEDAGFALGSMPAIGVFDVVEHFKDDKALLSLLNSYLKKDGLIFITVPAFRLLWSVEDDHAGHYNRYTMDMLRQRLRDTGYEPVFDTYIFSILPLPVLLMRSIPSKLGILKESKHKNGDVSEYTKKSPVLDRIWSWELNKLQHGGRLPIGGSCLMVARKL